MNGFQKIFVFKPIQVIRTVLRAILLSFNDFRIKLNIWPDKVSHGEKIKVCASNLKVSQVMFFFPPTLMNRKISMERSCIILSARSI